MNESIKVNLQRTNENLCRVNKFAKYKYNWNDNGASTFDTKHLEIVKGILVMLKVQPEVFPTANNSIQFEYEKDNGDYLEFEIFADNRIHSYLERGGCTESKEIKDIIDMNKVVNEFYCL